MHASGWLGVRVAWCTSTPNQLRLGSTAVPALTVTGSKRRPYRARRTAAYNRPADCRALVGRRPDRGADARSRALVAARTRPIGSPLAIKPPSVLTGSFPPISSSPSATSASCSPSAQKPFSARWITSAPASVSCSWMTSTSVGALPAISYAARDASTVGPTVSSTGSHGLCTSNAPSRRVRTVDARK